MTGHITRDSIGKCASSNDLYATIRNPTAKPPSIKKVDTIESVHVQMERRALQFIGKEISKNFIVVARVGKFMFLAVAIPPYIFCYGVPKWILIEAIPFIFQKLQRIINSAQLFKPNDKKTGLINTLRETLKAISTKAAEYIHWVNKLSKALFVHVKHQIVAFGYRFLQPYLPLLSRSAKAAESISQVLNKSFVKGDKQIAIAREFVSILFKTMKQEFFNQFRPYAEFVKTKYSDFKKIIDKTIEIPRAQLQKFKTQLVQRMKKTTEVIKTTGLTISKNLTVATAVLVSYTARPIADWVTPKLQWMTEAANRSRENTIGAITKRLEQIGAFVQNVALGIKDTVLIARHAVVNLAKNLLEAALPTFIKQFFNPERGFKNRYKQFLSKTQMKWAQLQKNFTDYLNNQIEKRKAQLSLFFNSIYAFMKFIGKQIVLFPSRLWALTKLIYHYMVLILINVALFSQWTWVWGRILARLALQEMRSMAETISKSVSLKPSQEKE